MISEERLSIAIRETRNPASCRVFKDLHDRSRSHRYMPATRGNTINSSQYPKPLTPSHLLTMKSKVVMPPPGHFQLTDFHLNKRWRRVQYLANEFWNRWKKEFVQSLQPRQKWIAVRRNLQDDIVIIMDENLPRNRWKLARVQEAFPSDDGLVRKVKMAIATESLEDSGRPTKPIVFLESSVQKLILLLPSDRVADQLIPTKEPQR